MNYLTCPSSALNNTYACFEYQLNRSHSQPFENRRFTFNVSFFYFSSLMERLRRVWQLSRFPSLSRWSHCWLAGNNLRTISFLKFKIIRLIYTLSYLFPFCSFLSTERTSTLLQQTRPSVCSTWPPASASRGWRVTRGTSTRVTRPDVDPHLSWVAQTTAPSRSGINVIVESSTAWTARTKWQLYRSMTPQSKS